MTTSDNHSFRGKKKKHPFCVTICIFNFNIQQNKQDATAISANEGKTDDISDGYHRACLPFLCLLSFRPPPLTFFFSPPSLIHFYQSVSLSSVCMTNNYIISIN